MDVATLVGALGGGLAGESEVVVRLVLMAADQVTGEQTRVSSFVKKVAMAPALVGRDAQIAVEILGERHLLTPSAVIWDETHRVYILEVVWVVDDLVTFAEPADADTAWPVM